VTPAGFLSCCSDAALSGFRRIAEAVHAHGAAVFGQLYHPGASMRGRVNGLRLVPVGPSPVTTETNRVHILAGEAEAGGSVVIADERCDWVGMGVAEKLVRDGRRVRLCVIGDAAGEELEPMARYRWLGILHRLGSRS
jgi:hypothetical protein